MIKRLLFLVFVFTVFCGFFVSSSNAQPFDLGVTKVFWGNSSKIVQAKPGDKNVQLNIVLQNVGKTQISEVNAFLYLSNTPFRDSATDELVSVSGYPGSVKPGGSMTLRFNLNISENATLGVYSLPLTVKARTPRYLTPVEQSYYVRVPLLGDVRFLVTLNPSSIFPGNSSLTLNLENVGSGDAENVKVSLSISQNLALQNFSNVWYLGKIRSGENKSLMFPVFVSNSLIGSPIRFLVRLDYVDAYGVSRFEEQNVYTHVVSPGKPNLLVDVKPNIVFSGRSNNLKISLKNQGNLKLLNVEVMLTSKQSEGLGALIVKGGNKWFFGEIRSGESVEIGVSVAVFSSNLVGNYSYPLTVNLSYEDQFGRKYTESRVLGLTVVFQVSKPIVAITSYNLSSTYAYPGKPFTVKLKIENLGDVSAQTVKVSFSGFPAVSATATPAFASLTPTVVWLGDLAPNESRIVSYTVMASPTSSREGVIYLLEFNVSYLDENGKEFSTKTYVGVPIHSLIDLVLQDVVVSPEPAIAGQPFSLAVTLLNRGTASAMYAELLFDSQPPFISLSKTSYVGEIAPNTLMPVTLTGRVANVSSGVYPLKLKVKYLDEYGEEYLKEFSLKVKVLRRPPRIPKPSQPQTLTIPILNQTFLAVIVGVVVAVFLLAVFLIRRRRGKGEEELLGEQFFVGRRLYC
ncbi:MAG: hypothetical protein DRO36_02850 [Candidatus Hecatellales archaeon]|nr:MAG: hypothetical protein DRO36_02850 [Candidatus Hecatellales archaeon]